MYVTKDISTIIPNDVVQSKTTLHTWMKTRQYTHTSTTNTLQVTVFYVTVWKLQVSNA